jgi:hypothetical protein
MSIQRRQVIECGSMPSVSVHQWASIIAASGLAAPIAWMSPVKWRLISSMGDLCAAASGAAAREPGTGPSEGSRRHGRSARPYEHLDERDGGGRLALNGRRHRGEGRARRAWQAVERREPIFAASRRSSGWRSRAGRELAMEKAAVFMGKRMGGPIEAPW